MLTDLVDSNPEYTCDMPTPTSSQHAACSMGGRDPILHTPLACATPLFAVVYCNCAYKSPLPALPSLHHSALELARAVERFADVPANYYVGLIFIPYAWVYRVCYCAGDQDPVNADSTDILHCGIILPDLFDHVRSKLRVLRLWRGGSGGSLGLFPTFRPCSAVSSLQSQLSGLQITRSDRECGCSMFDRV
jgi:hypothetical protein